MINDILKESESKMKKSIDALHNELGKLRTGRANVGLLDSVKVDYYGALTPLSQAANISVMDSRTLSVTPWDKSLMASIEKAIVTSDLGLNPANMGEYIRVPLPPLTEERRKELTKVVRQEGENAKVAVRNIRRDANAHIKDLQKDKEISEDDQRRAEDQVQKLTDNYIAEIDKQLTAKEADLMEV